MQKPYPRMKTDKYASVHPHEIFVLDMMFVLMAHFCRLPKEPDLCRGYRENLPYSYGLYAWGWRAYPLSRAGIIIISPRDSRLFRECMENRFDRRFSTPGLVEDTRLFARAELGCPTEGVLESQLES